ncbi:MAG TPA: hypothetical protein VMM35_12205 [Longimicrobiales bacterium]|nr:hypothetical protein [Longimicrobiales bacterium]
MTIRRALWVLASCSLLAAFPAAGEAQEPPPRPPQEPELVFEREVFQYPAFQRRNPFMPLEGAQGGVRFEQLSLIGIMYSPDPTASVAIMSTGGVTVNADGTTAPVAGDAYNVKVGQTIGNTTIREIQRDRVIVDVTEFGLTDRRTMFFQSRRQGGSQ